MPRRMSDDYPDAFYGWNLISSIGSLLLVVAHDVLNLLFINNFEGKAVSRYPWLTHNYLSDTPSLLYWEIIVLLEWCLT